jgi:hypothetical protein
MTAASKNALGVADRHSFGSVIDVAAGIQVFEPVVE